MYICSLAVPISPCYRRVLKPRHRLYHITFIPCCPACISPPPFRLASFHLLTPSHNPTSLICEQAPPACRSHRNIVSHRPLSINISRNNTISSRNITLVTRNTGIRRCTRLQHAVSSSSNYISNVSFLAGAPPASHDLRQLYDPRARHHPASPSLVRAHCTRLPRIIIFLHHTFPLPPLRLHRRHSALRRAVSCGSAASAHPRPILLSSTPWPCARP